MCSTVATLFGYKQGYEMSENWLKMTAADLGRAIGKGEIDPVTLTDQYLDAISQHPLANRIYARTTRKRALTEAHAAAGRAASGTRRSLLDGVPISWKDLFDTAGTKTEAGSALLANRIPKTDAVVLQNATRAGLVCLGKTHMSELAFSGLGYNPITETPPSVNYPDCVAGGSSSGAAASVSFALAAAAVGSDTGGSVRIPAVWNDLVGLKTTSGRLSLQGVVPLCSRFDTVGPLCRSVEDATLMLAALEGKKPADLAGASLEGARFLILENVALEQVREQPMAGFQRAVECLRKAGATIVQHKLSGVEESLALAGVLFATEAYATWKTEIETAPEQMYPAILARFQTGMVYSGVEYVRAWQALDKIRATWQQEVSGYDAVIMPTSATLPPSLARLAADDEFYVTENLLALRNTRIGNLMGSAALTLPTGTPSTGIMFVTPACSEERLLRLGAAAELALA